MHRASLPITFVSKNNYSERRPSDLPAFLRLQLKLINLLCQIITRAFSFFPLSHLVSQIVYLIHIFVNHVKKLHLHRRHAHTFLRENEISVSLHGGQRSTSKTVIILSDFISPSYRVSSYHGNGVSPIRVHLTVCPCIVRRSNAALKSRYHHLERLQLAVATRDS